MSTFFFPIFRSDKEWASEILSCKVRLQLWDSGAACTFRPLETLYFPNMVPSSYKVCFFVGTTKFLLRLSKDNYTKYHYLLGLISHQLGPTAFWALFSRPDRGRPTLHGWWAPVTLRYKRKVRAGGSDHEVERATVAPPT